MIWLEGELLRVFLGTSDHIGLENTTDALLRRARDAGLSGGTALQGSSGFGANSVIHRPHLFKLSSDLPVVVEFVDRPERIEAFLPTVLALLQGGGLVTREQVRMLAREGDFHDR